MRWKCPVCGEEITGLGWRHHRSAHAEAYSRIVYWTILLNVGAAVLFLGILLASRSPYPLLNAFVAIGAVAVMWVSVVILFRTVREARAILEPVSQH